jgi:hypothetical protein
MGYMGQRTKREFELNCSSTLFNKLLPHKAASRVVWEREIDGFVKEFLEVLFAAIVWLASTTNDCYTNFLVQKLSLPFCKSLLYTGRNIGVLWTTSLLLFTLFLGRPYSFRLVNVYDRRLVFLCNQHDCGNHLVIAFFAARVLTINKVWRDIKYDRVSFVSNSIHNHGLSSSCRTIE